MSSNSMRQRSDRRWGALWCAALMTFVWAPVAVLAKEPDRIQARVLEVRPGAIAVIDAGSQAGVREREVFDIYEPARSIKLPLTDEIAYVPERVTARLVVLETEPSTAIGRLVAPPGGNEPNARRGDLCVSNPLAPSINVAPYIKSLTASSRRVRFGDRVEVHVEASDERYDRMYYEWSATAGHLLLARTSRPDNRWLPPATKGRAVISVTAVDTAGNRTRASIEIENLGFTGIDRNVYRAVRRLGGHAALFSTCRDIAFDEQGNAYLFDVGNEQIIGMREDWTRTLKTEELRLDVDLDRAVCRGGFLYAIDLRGRRALKLRIGQKMLQEKPVRSYGARGVGNARFETPADIAVDSAGRVYVLDVSENAPAVHIFEDNGRFVAALGARGKGSGSWSRPRAIALDHDDRLYVLDDGRKVVMVYEDLLFKREFSVGAASDRLVDCKVDPFSATLSVLDAANGKIRSFSPEGKPVGKVFGRIGRFFNQWEDPKRLRFDGKGTLYLISNEGKVLHRLDPIAGVERGRWGGVRLDRTSRIAVGPGGRIAMLMARDALVATLDESGWITALFGGEGKRAGKFDTPIDVAVDRAGSVAVLDSGKRHLEVFDSGGNPLRVIGRPGSGATQLDDVVALGTDAPRVRWLTVQASSSYPVKVFSDKGTLEASFPANARALEDAVDVCMSATGRVYVAIDDGALWYFDLGSVRKRPFIAPKSGSGGLRSGKWRIGGVDRPKALTVSNIGLLFVVERGEFVQVWDTRRSRALTQIKDPKRLGSPEDVAVDDYDRVYVWDADNARVVVFER